TATDPVSITALKVPPTVNPGQNQTVNEGVTVTLSGTFTDPGTSDTFTQSWTVTDASGQVVASGTGATISFVPSDDGVYTGKYTVTDDDGGTGTGTVTVTALPVAPAAFAGSNQTVHEGDTVTLTGTFTDPSSTDTFSQSWVVTNASGQVVASGSGATSQFVPNDDGIYTGTYSVTDTDGGGTGTGTVTITVLNVPPMVNPGQNQTVNLGSSVTLSGTFTDPGTADTFTQTWVVTNSSGQVVASGNGPSLTFVPSAAGPYNRAHPPTPDDSGGGRGVGVITLGRTNTAP